MATGECGAWGWSCVPSQEESADPAFPLLFHSPVQVERKEPPMFLGLATRQGSTELVASMSSQGCPADWHPESMAFPSPEPQVEKVPSITLVCLPLTVASEAETLGKINLAPRGPSVMNLQLHGAGAFTSSLLKSLGSRLGCAVHNPQTAHSGREHPPRRSPSGAELLSPPLNSGTSVTSSSISGVRFIVKRSRTGP